MAEAQIAGVLSPPLFFFFFGNGLSSGFVFLFASVGSEASKMSLAVRRARWPPSLAAQTSLGDLWAGWLYRDVPPFFRAPLVYSEGILGGRLAEHANTAGEGEPRGGESLWLGTEMRMGPGETAKTAGRRPLPCTWSKETSNPPARVRGDSYPVEGEPRYPALFSRM